MSLFCCTINNRIAWYKEGNINVKWIRTKKFYIIEKLVNGELTRKEAAYELNLSLKQIDRLKKLYYSEGERGFAHKSRGKKILIK